MSSTTSTTPFSITNGLELEKASLVKNNDYKNENTPEAIVHKQQQHSRLSSTCSTLVIGILLTEAMQSFAFYGSQIVLVLYLRTSLGFSENSSIALFSFLSSFADLTPIVGAICADGWWGRRKTILYFGTVAAVGLMITTIGAAVTTTRSSGSQQQGTHNHDNAMLWRKCVSFIGLILLFVGIGCIDPCLSSFGADQVVGTGGGGAAALDTNGACSSKEVDLEQGTTANNNNDGNHENTNNSSNNNNPATTTTTTDAEEQQQQQDGRVRAYFCYLYFCTNVGAVTSCGLVPLVREYEGFGMAFMVCAVCMSIGLASFMSQRNKFNQTNTAKKTDPNNNNSNSNSNNKDSSTLLSTFALCAKIVGQRMRRSFRNWTCHSEMAQPLWYEAATSSSSKKPTLQNAIKSSSSSSSWISSFWECGTVNTSSTTTTATIKGNPSKIPSGQAGYGSCDGATGDCCCCCGDRGYGDSCCCVCDVTNNEDVDLVRDAEQALRVVPIMAMLPIFWMLYDQQESVWILQASRMSLHGLQPEQLSLINPIQIMMFIPLFDRYVYPTLTQWNIMKLDPLSRMGVGMLLAACAFLVSGMLEIAIQHAESHDRSPPSVLWQLIQITLMAMSEILVSVTGLEFSYSAAPAHLKAFLMAIYSLTKACGDLFGGLLYSTLFQEWNRATVMYVCALLMILNRLVFDQVANEWNSYSKPMPSPPPPSARKTTKPAASVSKNAGAKSNAAAGKPNPTTTQVVTAATTTQANSSTETSSLLPR